MDPHSENYYSWSPYVYVRNNSLRRSNPNDEDWRDLVVGYAIGFTINIVPLSSSVRDSYSLTSSSDNNRALQGAAIAVGGYALIISGEVSVAGGVYLMANTANNKFQGYDREQKFGEGSDTDSKTSKETFRKVKD